MYNYLTLLLLLFSTSLSAQYQKGTFYLGQESQVFYLNNTRNSPSNFGIRGRGGYFLRDRLLVGSSVQIGDVFDSGSLRLAPFTRYYVPLRSVPDFHLFGEVKLDLNFGRDAGLTPAAAIGAEYWLAPGAVLTASIRYRFGNDQVRRSTTIGFGFNVLLGEQHETDPAEGYLHQAGDLYFNPSIGSVSFGSFGGRQKLTSQRALLDGGLFLSDQIAVVGLAEFSNFNVDVGSVIEPRIVGNTTFILGGGLRYQFSNGKRWQPYVHAGARYVSETLRTNILVNGVMLNEITGNSFLFDLGPGLLFHLSRYVALDASLRWRPLITEGAVLSPDNRVSAEIGVVIFPTCNRSEE